MTAKQSTRKPKALGTEGIQKFNRVKPATNVFITVLFILLALMTLLPAVFVLILSLSSERSIQAVGYSFFPAEWSLDTYAYLWRDKEVIGRALFNSVFVTVGGTFIGLVLCSTMGYALSRPNYYLKKFYTVFIFIPMLFGGGLVASFMVNTQIYNLRNTYWILMLPLACSTFYIIIMRTFFQTTVPDSVIESAKIDGARQFRIFGQIVLPISLPAIATIGLFFTFGFWNDWFLARVYLNTNRQDLYPLQYVLISIERNIEFMTRSAQYMTPGHVEKLPGETIRMAIVMVVVLPIACSYPFFQKYFISGLTIGAVKG
ncbi:MAG: carbohydrate ABC transporter permease [Clostridia bacterium]|nr:carbohydrate ABC transporter permease [Clostridia bacterium]